MTALAVDLQGNVYVPILRGLDVVGVAAQRCQYIRFARRPIAVVCSSWSVGLVWKRGRMGQRRM